jgi:FAD-dependent urate hydroxylase
MALSKTEVAIIGAGPYGLAAAAHLRGRGIETVVFGQPMEFWEQQMPKGMLLRSAWYACDISDPAGTFRLEDFRTSAQERFAAPVPLDSFVRYGHWFQHQIVPDLDRRRVERIDKNGAFRIVTNGETLTAKRVVVAAGISRFTNRPPEFSSLPHQLASHSSEHCDLSRFRGERVLVIGGGQSAFEGAAL